MARFLLALTFLTLTIPTASFAGSCNHSWQTASDGSACGNRAADRKAGGN
jgi:hypothetical protein